MKSRELARQLIAYMRSTASEEEEPSWTSSRAAAAAATMSSYSSAAGYALTGYTYRSWKDFGQEEEE